MRKNIVFGLMNNHIMTWIRCPFGKACSGFPYMFKYLNFMSMLFMFPVYSINSAYIHASFKCFLYNQLTRVVTFYVFHASCISFRFLGAICCMIFILLGHSIHFMYE